MRRILCLALLLSWLSPALQAQYLPPYEVTNIEKNRQWIAQRDRAGQAGEIGIFADCGVWHAGARALALALEGSGQRCRAFMASGLTSQNLKGLRVLILPGGFAPYQWMVAQAAGLESVRGFVEQGGTVLGICAGSYLLSRTVRYDGQEYPYPLGLFDGVAEGPIAGLATYPQAGPVTLTPTAEGRSRGLGLLEGHRYAYGGGPRFLGGSGVEVLARYPDGTPAVIRKVCAKGMLVASGVHFERPAPEDGDVEEGPPPAEAGAILKALLSR